MNEDNGKYDDIISLPHFEPRFHKRMSMLSRAAQFAPFAALTGYDAAIAETGRLTSQAEDIDDESADRLNRRMALLRTMLDKQPVVAVTYFVPDVTKCGGAYRRVEGALRTIDDYNFQLVMTDGLRVPIQCILDLDSDEFQTLR